MSRPTLSVTMCNYNHGNYIAESLEAILSQSFSPHEVVVVDDGSSDNSVAVIERVLRKYPNVRLLRNDKNMGYNYSISRCINEISGDYVYCAAPDDRVLSGLFEKSINILTKYPTAGLCCSDLIFFNDAAKDKFQNRLGLSDKPAYFNQEKVVECFRRRYFHIAATSSVMKRTSLLRAGKFIPELKWHNDWFALHVIAFREGICYIPESLAAFRLRAESFSASGRKQKTAQREIVNSMLNILKSPAYHDVLPSFKSSKVLSIYGKELIKLLMKYPDHRDYFCSRVFWYAFKQLLGPVAPSFVKNLYRSVRNVQRPEIYGGIS